jgi:hypothetical protein
MRSIISKINLRPRDLYWLLGALAVGLVIRLIGVLWGMNFPAGWAIHHIDEYTHWVIAENLIDPSTPIRWYHAYPKGMAAHAAVPWIILRLITGQLTQKAPGIIDIVVTGRLISVLYGTATILVIFLLARQLFRDKRVSLFAAWIFALGGLHVTQSHFFLADAAVLFWSLLGTYLLLLEMEKPEVNYSPYLMAAAFSFGMAFGLKMVILNLLSLVIITLIRRPRVLRAAYVLVIFLGAFALVNLFSFGYYDLFNIFLERSGDPYSWNRLSSLWLYIIESPSLVSLPILLLGIVGGISLVKKVFSPLNRPRFWTIFIVILLPIIIEFLFVLIMRKHFLRHLVPFVPWIAMAAAWSLVQIVDGLRKRNMHPAWIIVPVFLYLALFVFDGERVFIQDPRNQAAEWIYQNIPEGKTYVWRVHPNLTGYKSRNFPSDQNPEVVVQEMQYANHMLSGLGWKNSYPRDYRHIFDSDSQRNVDAIQSLFNGTAGYKEAARFNVGYFMPEYVLVDALLGDRTRNYVSDIVIFRRVK